MSLLREIGDSLVKYGEILINKTEDFTRTAKTRILIRKKENEINSIKIIIADHVIAQLHKNSAIDTELINPRISAINALNLEITSLRVKLEDMNRKEPAESADSQNIHDEPEEDKE